MKGDGEWSGGAMSGAEMSTSEDLESSVGIAVANLHGYPHTRTYVGNAQPPDAQPSPVAGALVRTV